MIALAAIDDVLWKWRTEGINLLPPLPEADVIATLNKIGRRYSSDVVALYCATGGMKDGETDSHVWALWPLDRVVAENYSYSRPYILFADFLIDSHLYCFKCEGDERSSVCIDYFNGEEPERVADNIDEFFNVYLRNPRRLEIG